MKIEFDKNNIIIELDITLECNVNCISCNRLCNYKKRNYKSYMNIQDIHRIFKEVSDNNVKLRYVNIMGGEPTLNKDFVEIYRTIKQYYCPDVFISTNGSNNEKIPKDVGYYDSNNSKNKKFIFRNMQLSPKWEKQELLDICNFPKKYGISVCKMDDILYYTLCACGRSVSIMLNNKKYIKTNLKDCLNTDMNGYYNDICVNCQCRAKKTISVEDNKNVSECFLEGLKIYQES